MAESSRHAETSGQERELTPVDIWLGQIAQVRRFQRTDPSGAGSALNLALDTGRDHLQGQDEARGRARVALRTVEGRRQELAQQISDLRDGLEGLRGQRATLEEERTAAALSAAETREHTAILEQQIGEIDNDLQQTFDDIGQREQQNERSREDLAGPASSAGLDLPDLTTSDRLEQFRNELRERNREIAAGIDGLEGQRAQLQAQVVPYAGSAGDVATRLGADRARLEALPGEIARQEEQLAGLEARRAEADDETAAQLDREIEAARLALRTADANRQQVQDQLAAHERALEEKQEQTDEIDKRLAAERARAQAIDAMLPTVAAMAQQFDTIAELTARTIELGTQRTQRSDEREAGNARVLEIDEQIAELDTKLSMMTTELGRKQNEEADLASQRGRLDASARAVRSRLDAADADWQRIVEGLQSLVSGDVIGAVGDAFQSLATEAETPEDRAALLEARATFAADLAERVRAVSALLPEDMRVTFEQGAATLQSEAEDVVEEEVAEDVIEAVPDPEEPTGEEAREDPPEATAARRRLTGTFPGGVAKVLLRDAIVLSAMIAARESLAYAHAEGDKNRSDGDKQAIVSTLLVLNFLPFLVKAAGWHLDRNDPAVGRPRKKQYGAVAANVAAMGISMGVASRFGGGFTAQGPALTRSLITGSRDMVNMFLPVESSRRSDLPLNLRSTFADATAYSTYSVALTALVYGGAVTTGAGASAKDLAPSDAAKTVLPYAAGYVLTELLETLSSRFFDQFFDLRSAGLTEPLEGDPNRRQGLEGVLAYRARVSVQLKHTLAEVRRQVTDVAAARMAFTNILLVFGNALSALTPLAVKSPWGAAWLATAANAILTFMAYLPFVALSAYQPAPATGDTGTAPNQDPDVLVSGASRQEGSELRHRTPARQGA